MLLGADAPDPLEVRAEGERTAVADLLGNRADGGVRRALGREPRDFRDFVKDAAVAGVWANG